MKCAVLCQINLLNKFSNSFDDEEINVYRNISSSCTAKPHQGGRERKKEGRRPEDDQGNFMLIILNNHTGPSKYMKRALLLKTKQKHQLPLYIVQV